MWSLIAPVVIPAGCFFVGISAWACLMAVLNKRLNTPKHTLKNTIIKSDKSAEE